MLRWISIFGGLLIMMGQHARSEALFYYFRLEDLIPATHLLRLIDQHVSFEFVKQQLKDSYSETGRPSIDPELLLRILLIGYLYGITSERKLVEQNTTAPPSPHAVKTTVDSSVQASAEAGECNGDVSPTILALRSPLAENSPKLD